MTIATKIAGVGVYVPKRKVTNDDVLQMLESKSRFYLSSDDCSKLVAKAREKLEMAGCRSRYWCEEHEYCTDIARHASMEALRHAGVEAKELDLIIFTGMSKAFVEPASAHVLRHELQALNANVFDMQDACTSFMKSIEVADALIRTGVYRKVLIAAGERTFDWGDFACKTMDELSWKLGSLTIGDAAGAMVLEATSEAPYAHDEHHMKFFYNIADNTYSVCSIGLNFRFGERYRLHTHSSRLLNIGEKTGFLLGAKVFAEEKWKKVTIDHFFLHDVSRRVSQNVKRVCEHLELRLPDFKHSYFETNGNIASVSLPYEMCLAMQDGSLKRNDFFTYFCPAAGVQVGFMFARF